MRTLVLVTTNQGKIREYERIFKAKGIAVEIPEVIPAVDETANTCAGNAKLKAIESSRHESLHDKLVIADDSGLFVRALGWKPGVLTTRYSGKLKALYANRDLLLKNMTGVSDRYAEFRTYIALARNGFLLGIESGVIAGRIAEAPQGDEHVEYDSVFIPEWYNDSFAELGDDMKAVMSQRRKACDNLIELLNEIGE